MQNKALGLGTSLVFAQSPGFAATTVTMAAWQDSVVRGETTEVTITRSTDDLTHPLAVDYAISGSATNFDDFDGLHGTVIIEANATSAAIPISARLKCDGSETVTLSLTPHDAYGLGASQSATVTLLAAEP